MTSSRSIPATKSNEAWAEQNLADATEEAVDRKVDAIRAAAGARYDDIEIQIVAPYVLPTDDREGTAEAIAGALASNDPTLDVSGKTVLASPYVLIGTEDQICDTLSSVASAGTCRTTCSTTTRSTRPRRSSLASTASSPSAAERRLARRVIVP